MILSIGLATVFWWPAISGRALTHAEASLTGGYYDFHRHFVQGWQFLDVHWNFGTSAGPTGNQMPVQIGLPHLFVGLGAILMVFCRWQGTGDAGRQRALWSVVGVCVVIIGSFMCCRWSQPLWKSLPLFKYVQFPWRFLGLVVFGSAICSTALGDRFAAAGERSAIIAALVGVAVLMAAYFPYYSQVFFFVGDANTRSVVRVPAAEVRAMQSAGVLIPFGLSMTGAQLRQMNERATSSDDFLPRDVAEKPTQPPTQTVKSEGGRVLESAQLKQNHYRSRVDVSEASKIELLQFRFPGWRATVDRLPARTAPSGPHAVVSCEVPPGEHVVEFSYGGLPQRRTGLIISILSAVICVYALFSNFFRRHVQKVTHVCSN